MQKTDNPPQVSADLALPAKSMGTNNLPIPLSSFIGREREIAEAKRLLSESRLVTLTGSGGCGKTRLAIEVGASLVDALAAGEDMPRPYHDGVWWVELSALADETLVPQAIAQTLGVREVPNERLSETLANVLRAKQLLLVVDNCEHLVAACAALAEQLLQTCPYLKILATSREALGIAGETVWTVPSLSLPDARQPRPTFSDLSRYEAVQLFVDRAVAVQPSWKLTELNATAVADVCQRLDGIPLAIELAAARVKVLKTSEIAARLDDRFRLLTLGSRSTIPRHQTLRAAIDWSYDLLTEPERVLLQRLSVFAGGCTLEAAEQVCTDKVGASHDSPLQPANILDLISHLVDKSLVIVDKQGSETRYHMLETIREYAHGRLEESGEAEAVRQRHAEFFVELAERVPPTMTSEERKARYELFDAEQDNCRAALAWALATGNAEHGLRLTSALGDYWFWWAYRMHEGWSWISQFLAHPNAQQFPRPRAYALRAAVNLLGYMGEIEQANRLADESLALFRESGDKAGMAWVLADKGMHAVNRGDYAQAKVLGDEGATLFREVSDLRGLAWALRASAAAEGALGNTTQSVLLFNEGITASQAAGDDANVAMCNMGLGGLAYNAGDYEHADALFQQAMTLSLKSGDADGVGYLLWGLADTALVQGNLERAASQFEASETQFRQTRQKLGLACVLSNLGYVRHLQGDDRAARVLLREAIALQQQQQLKSSLIRTIEWCACISADILQPQRAARLFGAAEAARERIGAPLPPGEKPLFDRPLERARAELDKPTFDVAWVEGRALTLDQAVESALEMPLTPEHEIPQRTTRRAAKKEFDGLTGREREIAVRIAQGESNREIAEALVVSERTVETHVGNILNKLGFSSRAQIRKWAVDKRLVKRVE